MRTALGGYTGDGLIMGAIGTIIDQNNMEMRVSKTAAVAAYDPEEIVKTHKRNFLLRYGEIEKIELKGPNFAKELRIIIYAGGKKPVSYTHLTLPTILRV